MCIASQAWFPYGRKDRWQSKDRTILTTIDRCVEMETVLFSLSAIVALQAIPAFEIENSLRIADSCWSQIVRSLRSYGIQAVFYSLYNTEKTNYSNGNYKDTRYFTR